ncbi:glutathione S-transferase [Hoeflea sp. IMCC20628]|uniref:glutathione S-transferase family protein n=1 Tax=Hoeflea sp. IMCC20628 TaxID=1620421 RepID=UPI00063BEFB5|nr:glutathione S-transferase family protein [Hoeflea sp. IMCC20628]AKI00722.1 glutathione S-transferase [Hoeflea sp. IMCC20628]
MTIEILGGPGSTCCCKVHLTALEKGQEVRETEVNVWKHENLSEDYFKLNRDGMIPTVLHEGMVFVESSVIMRYLDRRFPEPSLTPNNPVEAMRMDLLMKDLDDKYHDAIAFLSFSEIARDANGDLNDVGKARLNSFDGIPEPIRREQRKRSVLLGLSSDEGRRACGFLETMVKDIGAALEHGPFLAGSKYSLADAALLPYVHRLWILGCEGLWTNEYPQVSIWYETMKARPAFDKVFTRHQARTRKRQDPNTEEGGVTWKRFREALETIGSKPNDPAVRLSARVWSPLDDFSEAALNA